MFAVVATVTAVSALGVVLSRNIVRMAVWLLFTLIGVSLLYFLLGAEFVGAAQLIVYVGGTLVLVVFGVMLTASGPLARTPNAAGRTAPSAAFSAAIAVRAARRGIVPHRAAADHRTKTSCPASAPLGLGVPGRDRGEPAART